MLPYARPAIDEDDIAAVVEVLRTPWLSSGPRTDALERAICEATGAPEAVACSSGTAALQLALAAADVGPGSVCLVPAITFLSTATAALVLGADVAFVDVDPASGLMDVDSLEQQLNRARGRARAVLPVHLGGRLCDLEAVRRLAEPAGAVVVEDAAHALGARTPDAPVGACEHSATACFSLHAIKTVAAGEGGAVTTRDPETAARMRRLRNHGVTRESARLVDSQLSLDAEGRPNPWSYEQQELGFNLRMDEMSAALALSQMSKLERFAEQRRRLSARYDALLADIAPLVRPTDTAAGPGGSPHLYQVAVDFQAAGVGRAAVMRRMADRGIGTQVHYIPLYRQPYMRRRIGSGPLPGAEAFYAATLSLPLHGAMTGDDPDRVVEALSDALGTA